MAYVCGILYALVFSFSLDLLSITWNVLKNPTKDVNETIIIVIKMYPASPWKVTENISI